MAKNNTKAGAASDSAGEDAEIFISETGVAEGGQSQNLSGETSAAPASAPPLGESIVSGIKLHEFDAQTPAGQIAARSALSVAHFCVYGKYLEAEKLNAWAEGEVILEATPRDSGILHRICGALGVRTVSTRPE